MKKVVVLAVAAVLTANYAMGQFSIGGKETYIGVRAGLNFNKFGGSDIYNYLGALGSVYGNLDVKMTFKPGIQLGAVADVALMDGLSLQPGLLFSQMGSKITTYGEASLMGATFDYESVVFQTLNYVQIPVQFQYRNHYGSNVLWLQAGPYLGFGLGTKYKTKVTFNGEKTTETMSGSFDDANLKMVDLGFGLGIGLEFSGNIQAGVVYNLGIANLIDDGSLKNKGLSLTVTYMFNKK